MDDLNLKDVFKANKIITDDTQIIIRDNKDIQLVAAGKWFEDNILEQADKPIERLSYYAATNRLHITLKCGFERRL